MPSNTQLLSALDALLHTLGEKATQTTITVHGAPALDNPAFLERLAELLPHEQLIVLGDPADAPAHAFPCVVSLFTGPVHADPPGWSPASAGWFHAALTAEFNLRAPDAAAALVFAPDAVPAAPKRIAEPLPLPVEPVGASSHPQGDTPTPVSSCPVKYVEPLPAPVELPRDPLQVLAERAGVVAERDERGHVSIRDDRGTLIWAGPLRHAFAELEGRARAASKLQPLGDRGL